MQQSHSLASPGDNDTESHTIKPVGVAFSVSEWGQGFNAGIGARARCAGLFRVQVSTVAI